MLKKIFIPLSLLTFALMTVPAFADDSDLNPEAIPGDEDQQHTQMDNPGRNQADNQAPVDNPNAHPLSPQEEKIIDESQAQFETEQNNLQPNANNPNVENKMYEEDKLAKEDKRLLKQDQVKARQDEQRTDKIEEAEQNVSEEQRNLQKYQVDSQNKPGRRDW